MVTLLLLLFLSDPCSGDPYWKVKANFIASEGTIGTAYFNEAFCIEDGAWKKQVQIEEHGFDLPGTRRHVSAQAILETERFLITPLVKKNARMHREFSEVRRMRGTDYQYLESPPLYF